MVEIGARAHQEMGLDSLGHLGGGRQKWHLGTDGMGPLGMGAEGVEAVATRPHMGQ